MAKIRDIIELLAKKSNWDAECTIEGVEGEIEISETTVKGKTEVNIRSVRGGH